MIHKELVLDLQILAWLETAPGGEKDAAWWWTCIIWLVTNTERWLFNQFFGREAFFVCFVFVSN